jgi:signal transduction histidine kinase
MTTRASSWFLHAGMPRVAVETSLLTFALMLPLAIAFAGVSEDARAPVLTLGAIEIGLLSGVLAGARLPLSLVDWRAAIQRELPQALGLALVVGAAVALAGLVSVVGGRAFQGASDSWAQFAIVLVYGLYAAVASFIALLLCRALRHAWAGWNRLRRSRLRWALTHAVLLVSLVLALIAGALLTAADFGVRGNFMAEEAAGVAAAGLEPGQVFLSLLVTRFAPSALALFLFSVLVGVVIVPPVAAISFPVVGRATRRLEDLTAATAALRSGDLAARSAVSGEDEIARLQADFNTMAADLQRAHERLRAERDAVSALLDERRELIAAVSHELRTPLATLRAYLDAAATTWTEELPAPVRHDLRIMTAESERLARLVEDLFTLSRVEIGRLPLTVAPVALAPLLQRVADTTGPLAWKRGRVEVLAQLPARLPPALVDAARLEQAVGNLVTNAVRHTPPGGLVLLTAQAEDDAVLVQVRDTGEGIAAADLSHIWERFYRGQENRGDECVEREGAGLGLALVKELVEAMGGCVAVASTPGEGSCFSLRLPVA